jgi:hypothetical protein
MKQRRISPEQPTIEDSRHTRHGGTHPLATTIVLLCVGALPVATGASPVAPDGSRGASSPLGIGFLWTAQSEPVVDNLKSEKDFVDVILGPGKLDIFQKVRPPVRVACIARSLEKNEARPFPGIKETIEILRKNDVAPERVIITYNPEGQPGTPSDELRELVASSRRAKEMAKAYGAPLLVGPGLRDMQGREHLYPDLAKTCDMWMIQSQRLQLDEATRKPVDVGTYREQVKRIVGKLREGNPKIRIFVQLVTTAERGSLTLSADQIVAFARSIEDLVEAVRIYGAPADLLNQIIERLRPPNPKPTNP